MKIEEYYINKFIEKNSKLLTGTILVVAPKEIIEKVDFLKSRKHLFIDTANFLKNNFTKKYDSILTISLLNHTDKYELALEKIFSLLKLNGRLLSSELSLTNGGGIIWGFTKPSMKILFDQYFDSKHSDLSVYGNALAGRFLIENKDILDDDLPLFDKTDIHFSVLIGFSGKKLRAYKKHSHKYINILVDEDKKTLSGGLVSFLKRTPHVFDWLLSLLRGIRALYNRTILTPKQYFQMNGVDPVTKNYGYSRGRPIDRYYIEKFLDQNKDLIKGHTLEIVDNTYSIKYGGSRITKADALDIFPSQRANIQGDLRNLLMIADETYDCLVITQTYFLIDDYVSAIRESKRILKKGGTLIATLSTVSPAWNSSVNMWRFSQKSVASKFGEIFGKANIIVRSFGNKLSTKFFWLGFSQSDLSAHDLKKNTKEFPLIIGVIAKKK